MSASVPYIKSEVLDCTVGYALFCHKDVDVFCMEECSVEPMGAIA